MNPVDEVLSSRIDEVLEDPHEVKRLSGEEIYLLLKEMISLFEKEKILVRLAEPRASVFIGDTHGDFDSTISVVSREFLSLNKDERPYLIFLGDYVDRGMEDVANFNFVSMLKLRFPERVVMLRGNHESDEMNRKYGFYSLATRDPRISEEGYRKYQDVFGQMPLAVFLSWNKVFGVHGGVPFDPRHSGPYALEELDAFEKGRDIEEMPEVSCQILYGDPRENLSLDEGYMVNYSRGVGYFYGRPVFEDFTERNDISLVIRSHQVFEEGHRYFFDNRLLSIFSARNYSGYFIDAMFAMVDLDGRVELLRV